MGCSYMLLLETLLWKNSCPSLQARVIVDKPSAERGSNNKQKKKKKKEQHNEELAQNEASKGPEYQ